MIYVFVSQETIGKASMKNKIMEQAQARADLGHCDAKKRCLGPQNGLGSLGPKNQGETAKLK